MIQADFLHHHDSCDDILQSPETPQLQSTLSLSPVAPHLGLSEEKWMNCCFQEPSSVSLSLPAQRSHPRNAVPRHSPPPITLQAERALRPLPQRWQQPNAAHPLNSGSNHCALKSSHWYLQHFAHKLFKKCFHVRCCKLWMVLFFQAL